MLNGFVYVVVLGGVLQASFEGGKAYVWSLCTTGPARTNERVLFLIGSAVSAFSRLKALNEPELEFLKATEDLIHPPSPVSG